MQVSSAAPTEANQLKGKGCADMQQELPPYASGLTGRKRLCYVAGGSPGTAAGSRGLGGSAAAVHNHAAQTLAGGQRATQPAITSLS